MKLNYLLFLIVFFTISCASTIQKEQEVKKEFESGLKYFDTLVAIFNKAELNKTTTVFKKVCTQFPITPVMKLQGYNCVFLSFERAMQYDSALMYVDSCIETIEKYKIEKYLQEFHLNCLTKKASLLFLLHQPEQANNYFYKVKKKIETIDSLRLKHLVTENLGFIAYRQKNYNEALESFKKVLNLQEKIAATDYYKKTEIIDNIGLCYNKLKYYDSALILYNQALDTLNKYAKKLAPYIHGESGNKVTYNHSRGVVVGNIASVYNTINQYDSAIKYSKESFLLNNEQQGERYDAQKVASQLIDIYIKQNKISEANIWIKQVKKGLDSLPDAKVRMNLYKQMATVLEKQNNKIDAFANFKIYNHIKDSLSKIELKEAENNIVKDLKLKNQEADLTLLKKDNELNQLYILIAIGLVVAAIIIATLIFTNYKKSKRKNEQLIQLNNEITQEKQKTEYALQELEISIKDKDRILRIVAHDLRNPLSGIAAASKTILETDEEVYNKKLMQMIEKTSNHSLYLINELLQTHSHRELELDIKNININNLLQHCYSIIEYKVKEKNQYLSLNLPNENVQLKADEAKMERVLLNLLNNAVKFTPLSGTIEMALQVVSNNCLITIKDNGIGIDNKEIDNIFIMFNNARKTGTAGEKSFGLGLSICKQIIEAHKGTIWVESELGKGSCFFIKLPL